MKIKASIDENGYLLNYAIVGDVQNSTEIEIAEDFNGTYHRCYKVVNGEALLDLNKKEQFDAELVAQRLRTRREVECFSVINRGGLWYDLLNDAEKTDLLNWYSSWLDVTETGIIPEPPTWLK